MFAAESYTSRHYIAIVAMACLCVLLGGPSYAAGAESLIIAGATYYEPGVSGPGWSWTDADHLELNGYAGEAIGADGDLVVTLAGQNSVTESHAPDADITLCGMEVWGNLTLRGTGTLTATGSQATWPRAAAGASLPLAPGPEWACVPMACICRMRALAMARPAVGFPSTLRGLTRPVPMAALRAQAGRLCPHGL